MKPLFEQIASAWFYNKFENGYTPTPMWLEEMTYHGIYAMLPFIAISCCIVMILLIIVLINQIRIKRMLRKILAGQAGDNGISNSPSQTVEGSSDQ